uniref:Uncharacterized protein n=1 Tax=Salix viminalis TaxID=40686 RepID=A0A6N2N1V5_SALVM
MGSNPIREHMGNEARLLNSLLCHLKIGIIGFISRGAKDAALYQNQTCTIVPRPFRIRKLVARKWLYQGSCWIAEQSKKANTDQRAYPNHASTSQPPSSNDKHNEFYSIASPHVAEAPFFRKFLSHKWVKWSGSRTQRAQFVRRLKTFRGRRETGGHDPAFDCQNKKEDTKTQLLRDLNKVSKDLAEWKNFEEEIKRADDNWYGGKERLAQANTKLPSVFSSFGFTATYTGPTSLESNLASRKFEQAGESNSLTGSFLTFLLAAGSSYSLSPPLPTLSSSMDLRMASSEVQMAFDPLSPFVLCMERLSQAISKAVDFGAWKPGKRWAEVISPLLRRRPYSLCGGKKVSDSKTRIFCSRNVPASLANRLSTGFGFELTNNLGRYWGMPLLHERLNLTRARSGLIRIPSLFPFPPAPFFRNEKEDGTLELYYLSAYCLPKILLLQLVGHRVIQISCVFRGFPMLQLPYQRSEMDWLNISLGSLVLTLMCGIHSRSALGITSSSGWNSSQNPTTSPTLLPPTLSRTSIETELFHVLSSIGYFSPFLGKAGRLVGSPDRPRAEAWRDSESELSMPVTLVAFFFVMPFLNFFLDPFPSMGMGGSSPQVKSTFHVIKGACTLIITYLPGSLLAQ